MMDCKRALETAAGDMALAERKLKEMGLAAAAKRSGRDAKEGRVFSLVSDNASVLLELSSETDFVARNDQFVALGGRLTRHVLDKQPAEVDGEMTDAIQTTVAIIKENIELRRFRLLPRSDNELIVDYLHGDGAIGVLVKLQIEDASQLGSATVRQTAFDLALHVAAFAPVYLSRDKVDAAYVADQESIFRAQAEKLGKPENVTRGITQGKLNKHLAEVSLLEQAFVKDEKVTVQQLLKNASTELGTAIRVADFVYFRVGDRS